MKFQRKNPYNQFLPYSADLEEDADKYLLEIKANLKNCLKAKVDLVQTDKWMTNLQKYVALYGLRFPVEDHVWFIQVLYGLLTTPNVDPLNLDKYGKLLVSLCKKKYLLSDANLILDWKPLYKLLYRHEDSSSSARGMIKNPSGLKTTLRTVVKFTRSFFSQDSTQEMLDEWRPLLCPFDRCMIQGMKYLSLFLPTTSSIPPEKGWKLWLEEFFTLWYSFSNSPSWEVELFNLYTRLAFHNTGRIDWTPYVEPLFTKFMVAFCLPVTYGQSGVKVKFGLSESGSFPYISRWIVSALGGKEGQIVQDHLDKMLLAIESYFHPANSNVASEALHSFVHNLVNGFIYRLHLERHNEKWESKTPMDKRLTDENVDHFIRSLLPVVFHIVYNPFEEERKSIFHDLATIRPDLIIPPLLERLQSASESLTEPHRFTACLATLSSCSRPFVENYPLDVIKVITVIVPGININDIWKSTDIFILLSDLLEMIWLIDFSNPGVRAGIQTSEEEDELLCATAVFEDFVLTFTDHCLTLLENSSREQISHDADVMEESLNEEELAADAAITETFQKLLSRVSMKTFNTVYEKLKRYAQEHILEPAVSGAIFAAMVKGCAVVQPDLTLDFFIPHLCTRIEAILGDRSSISDNQKVDTELQFNMLMLGEVISVKMLSILPPRPSNSLFKHMDILCQVFDKILMLDLKDEYEMASNALENLLFNIVHMRPLQNYYANVENPPWSKEEFSWGKFWPLEDLKVDWYVPGKQELEVVQNLFEKYFLSQLKMLEDWVAKTKEMEKEELLRTLRQIYKIIHGSSELLPTLVTRPFETSLSSNLKSLKSLELTFKDGNHIRQTVFECLQKVQNHLLKETPDDTDSLNAVTAVYDVLLFSFGLDEDELNDHMEEHRTIKMHRMNKLISGKKHLKNIHINRICIQHETHVWLKNFLVDETLPRPIVHSIFQLSVSNYSEVRSYAQDLLMKIVSRVIPESHEIIIPLIANSLKSGVAHHQFKGALYILSMEKYGFFYSWKNASILMPALVQAQHSDKQSIVDLLKDFSVKCNRSYSDFALYSMPVKPVYLDENLLKDLGIEKNVENMEIDEEDEHFLHMEKTLADLVMSGNLHWRHYQMAVGMLLTMLVADRKPPKNIVELWINCLLHDDITIRFVAFQAVESILKLYKVKKQKTEIEPPIVSANHPGHRQDNSWMQYDSKMSEKDLENYWTKPFAVKPQLGFYAWPVPKVKLRISDDTTLTQPDFVPNAFMEFFSDKTKLEKFIELNTMEIKKGEDLFSMDKALFYCSLFDQLGPHFLPIFAPYVAKFCASSEESEQRCAAEIVFGMIKGSRFWTFEPSHKLWKDILIPTFKTILSNVTTETIQDWEICLSGATNNHDPKRLKWLLDFLIEQSKVSNNSNIEGAFSQASCLKMLNKSIVQNWKLKDIFLEVFTLFKDQSAHPYNKVRHQISGLMATVLSLDILYGENQNMGNGYPSVPMFIDYITPKLTLNFHNPVFIDENSCGMDVDQNNLESDHILETVALWVTSYIQSTSTSLRKEVYQLLPYFCQFVGNETGQEVSQTCLKSLCYLSVCITPKSSIDFVLEMIWKVSQSSSWKAKMSILEFCQTFVFTNFMSLCLHENYVKKVEDLIVKMMSDEMLQVRQKATKILSGLIHSQFISIQGQQRLLKDFRAKIRRKMSKKNNKFKKANRPNLVNKEELANFHSGILGLCAAVEAYPYDVPEFVPDILIELEKHLHDPLPIPKTIKDCFQEFKRTHQDNWQEHKLKFSENQLSVMTDLLVSPNYYA